MNPYDQVRLMAKEHPRGVQIGGLNCPFCNGGRNHDRAFSIITRDDGTTLFVCHRATCGRHGAVDGAGIRVTDGSNVKEFEPRWFEEDTRFPHTEDEYAYLAQFGLDDADISQHQLTIGDTSGRLIVPVHGPDYVVVRGVEARAIYHYVRPKTLHYKEIDQNWLGWFMPADPRVDDRVVIVEDTISAMKVAHRFYAVALMGSHITVDDMLEIAGNSKEQILCLDRDATAKALSLKTRFQHMAPNMRVVPLERDLKWEPDERIRELIQ